MIKKYCTATGIIFVLTLFVSCFFSSWLFAATQGTIGSTSTGSVNISITKPPRASISGLSDMSVSNWILGSGDQILTNDVCVYSSRQNGGYTIKATGSGTAGAFKLAGSNGNLDYGVKWNDGGVNSLSNSGTTLTATVTSGGMINAATDSASCNGAVAGPTARLIVTILETDMEQISAGIYTGTLTLLVTPN